ncbi:Hypothetical protein (Fragment) [Durusdinium trenchii]|uniref:Dynamin N-terminal domain-containing protein n=1 Tax=Durusdinium trenchii TaxID=1381693 RepID=A0ABP0NBR1_9DINO
MSAGSNKLFEFTREVNHFCELQPESELAKIKVVPSYILVGDQSSGKTSLLSRLARLPLGYTANKTGTRRPVEYNLIHDDSKSEPDIEVNSRKVNEADFLSVMIKENGTEGFNDSAVSVKILWKNIPESVIVADMPGMKDGDNAPENMILKRLKSPNVIPVVILEPKDFDSKHFAFDLLKKAGRSYADIIAVFNKCDEKMAQMGQWSNQSDWTDFWDTARKKGFKKICITGWPCSSSDRNSQDLAKQKNVLGQSCDAEDRLIADWKSRVEVTSEAAECIGLDKFRQLHRLGELCDRSLPHIRCQKKEIGDRVEELKKKSKESLKVVLSQLMHEWAYEVLELVDGDVDVHKFNNSSKTAEEDLHELFNQGKQQFEQLPSHNLHRDYTKHFLKGCFFRISLPTEGTDPKMEIDNWIGLVSQSIFAPNEKLVGKAAFERTLDIAFTTSLCRTFQHALTEFDADFINTVCSKYSQDTGNKVIQQFVKRVLLPGSLHPMVDVVSLLVLKHLQTCFTRSDKPYSEETRCLKELKPEEYFNASANHYAVLLVQEFNRDLHERLEEHGALLQGRCRNGESNFALDNNCSGHTLPGDAFYADLAAENFCSAASHFLKMGMQVLGKAGVKSQQAVYFYELLLASAAQKNSQMNEKDMFPLGVEAKSVDKVRKLRSLPIPANKTIAITMDVKFQQQTSTKTEQPGIMSTLRNGDKSSQAGAEDKKLVGMELQDMRSDEGLLDEKEPCGPFVQVALNDFKENKWLLSKSCKCGEPKPVVTFEEDELKQANISDRFITVDVLVRQCGVSVTSWSIGNPQAHEAGHRNPETSVDSASLDASDAEADGEETLEQEVEEGVVSSEILKTAASLVNDMASAFKPLPGSRDGGPRDFRKLLVEASCELVEQVISFREILEKRLEKLKLTAKKYLGHKMSTGDAAESVLDELCKGSKKQLKKLEKLDGILEKALRLHREFKNPDPDSDSD